MRPTLDTKKIFAAVDGAPPSSWRIRSPLAHSVVMEAPRRAPPPAFVEMPSAPNHPFAELDKFLASRVLRLEVTGEDDRALSDARLLREALGRAGAFAAQSAQAVTGDSPTPSFESLLGETVRGVYAWAYGTLDAIFLGDSVRPLPKRVADALADHAEVCAMRGQLEPAFAALENPLAAMRGAASRLARSRP
jgi:hypothetical protein